MNYRCFLLTPVGKIRVWARRYVSPGTPDCCPLSPGQYSYHDNMNLIGDFDLPYREGENENWHDLLESIRPPSSDPVWPKTCQCGFLLPLMPDEMSGGQMFAHRLFSRSDNGGLTTLRECPPGGMWYAWWLKTDTGYGYNWDNQTTPSLICKMPDDREWDVDGRASNCDMKEDRTHRCWVRHGEPPNIHVDKNGHTCHAGAGSIISGNWHGFLHNGELREC